MRLTALELENFKGIGRRQRIELKPMTLLFGPNSAGKSMIIHALHYLHGILSDGELDPRASSAARSMSAAFARCSDAPPPRSREHNGSASSRPMSDSNALMCTYR